MWFNAVNAYRRVWRAPLTSFCLAWMLVSTQYSFVNAGMTGSGVITPHNYVGMGEEVLRTHPPSCGMPYASLDITRITAVETMDTSKECGTCLKVTNTNNPSKYIYVLAVDTGGRGLDISTVAYAELFGQSTDPAPASWHPVDAVYCADIWIKSLNNIVETVNNTLNQMPQIHGNDQVKSEESVMRTVAPTTIVRTTRPTATPTSLPNNPGNITQGD
jgi:hypothetical protein